MRRRKLLAIALTLSVSSMSCRESAKISGKGREMNQANQPATLAELAHEAGVKFPSTARLIGSARENGMDDLLRFKVAIPTGDLPAFLATSPVPADAFEPGEGGLLGPDEGFWDPSHARRLRTGQTILPGQRALNIGIDDGHPDTVTLYIVNHGT